MNRLPFYDPRTSQGELRLFLGLGLAAMGIIAITLFDSARFSNHREEIAAALCEQTTAVAVDPTNRAMTNLAVLRSGTTDERARPSGVSKPKS